MDYIPTCDPNIVIESQTPTSVIYFAPRTGKRWRIDGVCNKCMACTHWTLEDDARNHPRLDCPVSPEHKNRYPMCTLSGEYL